MKAILPVAGNGTRMYPLGVTTPKCLIPILNKPLLIWTIEALQQNNVNEIIFAVSAGVFGNQIREFIDQLHFPNLSIHIAVQEQQLGTAHVVQTAKDFFQPGEEFIFMYGDDLYGPGNIAAVLQTPGMAVTGMKVKDPEKWGIFQHDEHGKLLNVIEKPKDFVGDLANIGCMKLNTRVFELYDQLEISPRGEYELTDTLQLLAEETEVHVLETSDYWIPIGYPWHILDATDFFMQKLNPDIQGTVEDNVKINGNVVLPKSSTIKAGTYIEGNVLVGENTVIGPNAYLRGNVTIGNDCFVGMSVEVKNSVIGDSTRVPHLSYVGDSILGKHVNFAGTSITANLRHDEASIHTPVKGQMVDTLRQKLGTVIGDNVHLGVGTVIYPGRKIWPDKITRPGEVVDKDIVG